MKRKIGLLGSLCSAVCALVVLAGCSNEVAGTALPASTGSTAKNPAVPTPTVVPAPPGGSSSGNTGLVDWMNGLCDSFTSLASVTPEDLDIPEVAADDVAGQRRVVSETLGKMNSLLTPVVDKFKQLPPAPHPHAEKLRASILTTLGPLPEQLKQGKTKLDSSPPDDQPSLQIAAGTLLNSIGALDTAGAPLEEFKTNPELSGAWGQAPNCQKLPN